MCFPHTSGCCGAGFQTRHDIAVRALPPEPAVSPAGLGAGLTAIRGAGPRSLPEQVGERDNIACIFGYHLHDDIQVEILIFVDYDVSESYHFLQFS